MDSDVLSILIKKKFRKVLSDNIKFIEARDFSKEKPVPENIFRIYKNQFLYDNTPLDAIIEKRG